VRISPPRRLIEGVGGAFGSKGLAHVVCAGPLGSRVGVYDPLTRVSISVKWRELWLDLGKRNQSRAF
jgi:hypothetical protein